MKRNLILKTESSTESDTQKKKMLHNLFCLLMKIGFIAILYYVLLHVLFGALRMSGSTMVPYLTDGDLLIYYRMNEKYSIGDIIIAKQNNKDYVLRIVATEGQTVDIDEDGQLFVDGYPEIRTSFFETLKDTDNSINYPYVVPKDCVFALNDYRKISNDSRKFGPISKENINGKLIGRLQIRNF